MDKVIMLEDWHYETILGGGGDIWAISGEVFGHARFPPGRRVSISQPVEFDPHTRLLRTKSGSLYCLGRCARNETEQMRYIEEDIASQVKEA